MILSPKAKNYRDFDSTSFITVRKLMSIIENSPFKEELKLLFQFDNNIPEVIQVGNAKFLIQDINELDKSCKKLDLDNINFNNIYLDKILKDEKALFTLFELPLKYNAFFNHADSVQVETRYDAKQDILDFYNFSKFANFLRDHEYEDLINQIRDFIREKYTVDSHLKLRIIYSNEDQKYYLRAVATNDYRDFGINFSVFVALMTLTRYATSTKHELYINNYRIDDSTIYVSFELKNEIPVADNLELLINITLDNDELKRNAVSFNGVIKLRYKDGPNNSEIFIKPKGYFKKGHLEPVDLLTFPHRGKITNVFEKINTLGPLIDSFIIQVTEDTANILKIKHPNDIKSFLASKIKLAKKTEFQIYRERIFNKLMSVHVDTLFQLFELIREVEELFEHTDIISREFWRTKLYETLIKK